MEKRILLAVFLSFLVIVVYQSLLPEPAPRPAALPALEEADPVAPGEVVREVAPPPEVEVERREDEEPPGEVVIGEAEERDIVVETPEVVAVFSNRGAELRSWRLKHYTNDAGEALELVPQQVPLEAARPFTLRTGEAAVDGRLRSALFRPSRARVLVGEEPAELAFEYAEAGGLQALKRFRFDPAFPYLVTVSISLEDGERTLNPALAWGPAIGDEPSREAGFYYSQQSQGILQLDGSVERLDPGALGTRSVYEGALRFAGVDDHYFIAAALAPDGPMRIEYEVLRVPNGDVANGFRDLVAYDLHFEEPPSAVQVFFGPKDFDLLAAVDREMVRAIHFGVLSWLVVPLLRSLKWIHGVVGNYGWAIVILTVLINAAMFPLRHKSVVSMRKLQEIQPEIKSIQERYAKLKMTDPARQKMNTELMTLYRERGVNPASGCLPMMLTMPVLFAFYSLLSVAIEIRGAPFILWIQDLSTHDPYYVTPLLMGATMVWQMKITPTTADPMQQRIMMVMPIVFTFMFLWAPSGLVLYWFVSNVWAIGQQQITNRIIGPPVVRQGRPPAERRMKRAGAGQTGGAAGAAGSRRHG